MELSISVCGDVGPYQRMKIQTLYYASLTVMTLVPKSTNRHYCPPPAPHRLIILYHNKRNWSRELIFTEKEPLRMLPTTCFQLKTGAQKKLGVA